MIASFGDAATEDFFNEIESSRARAFRSVEKVGRRKLHMIAVANDLNDLRVPPGNRLEALKGNLAGYHSIRINDQWRVVFRWTDAGATGVRIADYH